MHPHLNQIQKLRDQGYTCLDLHVHTNVSKDAFTPLPRLLDRAKELGIGLAITDHNEIDAAVEAVHSSRGVCVIPGIEVKAYNGCDITVLFYEVEDLIAYYEATVLPAKRRDDFVLDITEEEIVRGAKKLKSVVIAVHPFTSRFLGLAGVIERGVTDPHLAQDIDLVEIRNGVLSDASNTKADAWAKGLHKSISAGSDAHILHCVGWTLTCVKVLEGEHVLDALLRGRAHVLHHRQPRLLSSTVFTCGQFKLLWYPKGVQRFTKHLATCTCMKTRTRHGAVSQ